MNAEVQVYPRAANTLPQQSVVNFEGSNYIFVAETRNCFRMQETQTGKTQGSTTTIKDTAG